MAHYLDGNKMVAVVDLFLPMEEINGAGTLRPQGREKLMKEFLTALVAGVVVDVPACSLTLLELYEEV